MSNDQNNLPVKRDDFTLAKPGSLLDEALSKLPKEQQERMLAKAIEKRIDIDAEAKIADLKYQASSVDMANTIRQVHALEAKHKKRLHRSSRLPDYGNKTIDEGQEVKQYCHYRYRNSHRCYSFAIFAN